MMFLAAIPVVLAALLWISLIATLLNLHSSDHAGNGLAQVYAVVNIVALWALLLIIVIIAMANDGGPAWMKAAAALLTLLSAAAAIAALMLMTERGTDALRWVIVVPTIIPPLLVAYALWSYFPMLRDMVSVTMVAVMLGVPTVALSLAPWVPMMTRMHAKSAHAAMVTKGDSAR